MTDFAACLQRAADAGEVDAERAAQAEAKYLDLVRRYMADGTAEAAARVMAADDIMESIINNTQRRRHTVLAQVRDLAEAQRTYAGIAARDPDALLRQMDLTEMERLSLEQRFMARIGQFLKHNRTRVTGQLRDKAMVEDVARELHGQATGNASAADFARAIEAVQEEARQMFNMLGGDIGKLEHRGVRHSHDRMRIRAAGFEAWSRMLLDRNMIDWSRIRNFETDKPFAPPGGQPPRAQAEAFLREVYDGIATDSWNRRDLSMVAGGKALYNRRAEHRVLHFRDGESWLDYNAVFGTTNPFDAIVGELRGMARDIALMRNFGPNPKAGVEFRSQIMERDAKSKSALEKVLQWTGMRPLPDVIARKNAKAQTMMLHYTGDVNMPVDPAMAAFFGGTRNLLTAAQLGSAPISQVTDLATTRLAAKSLELNQTGPWQNAVRLMTDDTSQQMARDLGYVFDTWFQTGSAQARFIGDQWSPEWTSRIANGVLRANGLAFITDRSRTAMRMTMSVELGALAGRGWAELPVPLRDFMANRGLQAADWDALRAPGAMYDLPTGGKAISPAWFAEHTDLPRLEAERIAAMLSRVVEEFVELGVPSSSLRGRATIIGDTRPGTFSGELLRSAAMYKSFTLSLMFNHMRRVMELRDLSTRAGYTASLIATTTLMGAVAIQLGEIAKGRDPQNMNPMTDPAFWGRAMLKGGGVGIFGDFITSSQSRTGGGLHEVAGGPVVGLASDVGRAVVSNTARALQGEETRFGRDAVNLARRYNPLASFWPTRTALDRMVWDQLQGILDPDANEQWRQTERRIQRELGTRHFWRRGQALPDRAPDFSNALGEAP